MVYKIHAGVAQKPLCVYMSTAAVRSNTYFFSILLHFFLHIDLEYIFFYILYARDNLCQKYIYRNSTNLTAKFEYKIETYYCLVNF